MKSLVFHWFPAVVLALFGSAAARADALDRALVHDSAAITTAVLSLGAENIAVLKFDVKVGSAKSNFEAGLANAQLAQKLENLLLLTNDPKEPLFLLTGSGSAELPPGATWRDEKGRAAIAKMGKLPLAWDANQQLNPTGFVTGELAVNADCTTATITLFGFTRSNPAELKTLRTVAAPLTGGAKPAAIATDRSILALAGISYAVSHANGHRAASDLDAAKQAAAQLGTPTSFADAVTGSPVRLEVVVNGEEVTPVADPANPGNGKISAKKIGDPKEGDKVHFRLMNTSDTNTYAVLLAVNGRNTNSLGKENLLNNRDAKDQNLWVLGPKEAISVRGFYTDRQKGGHEEFRVLGDEQSQALYSLMSGEYRGLVTLHVFGELKETAQPKDPPKNTDPPEPKFTTLPTEKEEVEISMLSLGLGGNAVADARKAGSLEKAQERIATLSNVSLKVGGEVAPDAAKLAKADRGLIVPGEKRTGNGPIQAVEFKLDPKPVAFTQLRYYQPGR